jgi:hypothetical protein
MATWFATATGNINTAGRWNSLPNGTGTALTWPPASNDVLVSNSFTITVNINTAVGELRNDTTGGATAGGYFSLGTAGISLSGTAYSASAYIVRAANASGIVYFVGDIYAGNSSTQVGFQHAGAGNAGITGNVYGGAASSSVGVYNTSTGTVTVTGTINGGSGTGYGVQNNSTGTVAIVGPVLAGVSIGAANTGGGTLTVSSYAQASDTAAAISNSAQGVVEVGETRSASNGRPAVLGAFHYASTTELIHKPIAGDGSTLTMKPVTAFTLPSEADVRNGVAYGGNKAGTLTGCNRHHRMSV